MAYLASSIMPRLSAVLFPERDAGKPDFDYLWRNNLE
jgi:hypothetical protein